MQAPLISILIPTLNAQKTLGSALDSILGQEFTDWEILVIDSVSKDGTMDMVKGLAARDARVRFISEPDKGIYDAMNKGVTLARGQWIYFLGSDDTLHDPGVLQTFRDDLAARDLDLVYGNIVTVRKGPAYDGPFTLEKLLRKNMSHQAAFYHRQLFTRIGGFNTRYRAYADWDFNIRCFSDPSIRTHYRDRVVALFGMDGISRRHDTVFLRESLIPANLERLTTAGCRSLRPITAYDDWWRLIRNAAVRSPQDLPSAVAEALPVCLRKIIGFQGKISSGILGPGLFSKFFMMISYCSNIITGRI
jgi:glycosyltransferase involved in cell wall biosynthesis